MLSLNFRQRCERGLARLMLALPAPWQRRLAGPPTVIRERRLDLQTQLLLKLQKMANGKAWSDVPLARARAQLDIESQFLIPALPVLASVETLQVQGHEGLIAARVFRPPMPTGPAPALIFYHGGGFVLGSLDSHDPPCRLLAAAVPCVLIAVDYRLAPEHPFPAGVNDAIAAFRDIAARAEALGLDAARLAVGGDSAGGNFAAVVAQQTRDDQRRPCHQLLIYPTVDATMSFPSVDTFASGFLLQKRSMQWFTAQYFKPDEDLRGAKASPFYGDVNGVAAATVQTAGFDPLCDEGEAYAERLRAAGVPVEAKRYEGLIHGYLSMSGAVPAARQAIDDMVAALRRAFA